MSLFVIVLQTGHRDGEVKLRDSTTGAQPLITGSKNGGKPALNAKDFVKDSSGKKARGQDNQAFPDNKRARHDSYQEATPSTATPSDTGPSTRTVSPEGALQSTVGVRSFSQPVTG